VRRNGHLDRRAAAVCPLYGGHNMGTPVRALQAAGVEPAVGLARARLAHRVPEAGRALDMRLATGDGTGRTPLAPTRGAGNRGRSANRRARSLTHLTLAGSIARPTRVRRRGAHPGSLQDRPRDPPVQRGTRRPEADLYFAEPIRSGYVLINGTTSSTQGASWSRIAEDQQYNHGNNEQFAYARPRRRPAPGRDGSLERFGARAIERPRSVAS